MTRKQGFFSGRGRFMLPATVIFCILATMLSGCDSSSSLDVPASQLIPDSERAIRLQAAIDNVEKVLAVNPDGTVSMDENAADYALLSEAEETFGKVQIAVLNSMIEEGVILINQDLSAEWLGPPTGCDQCDGSSSCKTHWWGEECSVSRSTTKKVCIGLESGEGALIICGFIPVVDVICEIIEVIGAIPLEAEVCPCSDRDDSSTFKATWVGAAWFSCN